MEKKLKVDNKVKEEEFLPLPVMTRHTEPPMHPCVWRIMLVTGVLIYGSYTILVHLCEVDGKIPFSSSSMVLVTEIVKLGLCMCMLGPKLREGGLHIPSISSALPFAVPAVLYTINNNIAVHIQPEMDPASYQVLGNLKILSTAFIYRLIIKRPIATLQWVALGLLAVAGACNSYGGLQAKTASGSNNSSASHIHVTAQGLLMVMMYCTISGLAGVYTEYMLKKRFETSIHLQNGLLYTFGIVLNFMLWLLSAVNVQESRNLLHGFSSYTWLLVITQAVSGLIMSSIMKYGNNITRLFLISCAMVATTLFSMVVFGLQLNASFCASFVLVLVSLALYHAY